MQYKLFYSKFKSSVGCSSLLDIVRDSSSGENPHHMVAMGLIFDRTIDDCQERMLAQARKFSQADPVVQPDGRGKAASTLTAVVEPATPQPLPPAMQSKSTTVQPVQTQAVQKGPDFPKIQPSQSSKVQNVKSSFPQVRHPSKPPAQPPTSPPAPPTSKTTSNFFDGFTTASTPPKPPKGPVRFDSGPTSVSSPLKSPQAPVRPRTSLGSLFDQY